MDSSYLRNFAISVEKQGRAKVTKANFPLRYGKYSEIRKSDYEFVFNLNGEIKFIRGLGTNWPHPAEQLKRTDGNDWVYYSVGDESGENGIISWMGEYYLPCLPYPSNPVWDKNYFSNPSVMNAFGAWCQLYADLYMAPKNRFHPKARELIGSILDNNDNVLHERAQKLHSTIGGRISVLPPDTRHVDYEIIPLNIADGCLYHCTFCCVKSRQNFQCRSETDIIEQICQLKVFYGRNLKNYNGLFLGNHDALGAEEEIISLAVTKAHKTLFAGHSKNPLLFLFGSVNSLLKSKKKLLEKLNKLPFYTYINIGLESLDPSTLKFLGKPLSESSIREAFQKMLYVNATYRNIEITANFVIGEGLSERHYQSLTDLLADPPVSSGRKGGIYLSPLKDSPKKRELLPFIKDIKDHSKLPVFTYLIQRL